MDKYDLKVIITDNQGTVMEILRINNDSPAEQSNVQLGHAIVRHIENKFEVLDDE